MIHSVALVIADFFVSKDVITEEEKEDVLSKNKQIKDRSVKWKKSLQRTRSFSIWHPTWKNSAFTMKLYCAI